MLVLTADASDESGACFSISIIQKTYLLNPFLHCKRLKSFVAMAFPERRSLILNWAVIFVTVLFHCGIANGEYAYRDALMKLKASIIDPLGVLDDWVLSDNDPCYWTGVSCNEDHSAVLALDLSEKSLSGTLSPAIGKLKGIVNLTLDLNNFTGPFPAEITALSTLRVLNISHNNFSRMFPQNLSYMCNLEVLDAYNNNFSGPLPEQLSQISTLRHLHLGGSYFEGTIPSAYGNMTQLRYMALCGNSLTGFIPPELGNMTHLEELYLGYYNQFDGGIPPQFGNLFNLIRLDLSSCGLNGSIPAQLGNLIKLDSLFLQINSLSGPIPPKLGYLINLKSLDLSNNKLTGRIPPELGYLENLELLMLFLNDLHGEVPGFLAELPKLQVLSLWSNGLSGKIPERLGSNGNLVEVDLSNNSLVGQIPPLLCKGGKLKVLVLLQNHLFGSIPASLGLCRDLNRVRLGDNQLSGPLPDGLLRLQNLDMLELIHNQLNGSIPSHIDAPILSFMDISSNHLQGPIPSDIGNLPHLQKLFLWNNFLSGPIPSEISNLSSLAHLDLRGNSLSGPIPDQLGKCSNMIYLDLSQNNLSGTIPPQLGSMPVLAFLNLSRNHLQGQIPNELNRLQSLTSADFSYNELSGPVPTDGQFEYFNISCFIGNPGLCGRGLQPCSGDLNNGIGVEIRRKPLSRIGSALLGSIFAFALCLLLVLVCFLWQRNENAHIFPWCGRSAAIPKPWRLTSFQKLDLDVENVLECLHEDNIIGQGGAGIVYRGQMPSGDVIAVKKLFKAGLGSRSGAHDDHGFSAEIRTLGKIRHRNIVKLLGFCSNDDHNLLLYEYMPNGSLGDLLHGKKKSLLDWNTRYKIALQAANGLCYLHHDCNPRIIHRDVKSNNILLDSEFEAHVADFGLAKPVLGTGENQSMSLVAGSCGYIAPEYACNLKVNEKADIYSFGVVLLELVTGKKPTDDEFKDGMPMVMWVSKSLEHERGILAVVDTCLTNAKLPLHEVRTVVVVALLCCCYAPSDRPTMREVVQMLTDCRAKSKSNSFKDTNNKESLEVSKEIPLIAL